MSGMSSSPKLFETSLGPFEYLLSGLTFLGVLYLVVKQMNLKIEVSKDGFAGNAGIRFHTVTDGSTGTKYTPQLKGREGFSMGSYEAPSWNSVPFDSEMLNQQKEVQEESSSAGAEGMASGYAKVASRQGMLANAMFGGNAKL